MNKINFDEVPGYYAMCAVSDCPMADHCLRQMALQALDKRERQVIIVNPKMTRPSKQCEFYRPDEVKTFGRGFVNMKEEMLPRQYEVFMHRLQGHFGRTGYFERKRGQRLCSPEDISVIMAVLQELGLSHLSFDTLIERYNW